MKRLILTLTALFLLTSFAYAKDIFVVLKTNQGEITLKMDAKTAPKTVENFTTHVKNGYYDGIAFHRVIADFMIQGGDPTETGRGGESIWGEPFKDEIKVWSKFDKKGLLAMANAGPKTNGSQFFITVKETPWLNYRHTIFGEVTEGMDVVERISKVKTDASDRPLNDQRIIKAYIKK